MLLQAALIASSLLFTPVHDGDSGERQCATPEAVIKVYAEHNLPVVKIDGAKLTAFNQAYETQFHHPAPENVTTLLLITRGAVTQVISFDQAGCVVNVGRAPTEVIQKLLGPGE